MALEICNYFFKGTVSVTFYFIYANMPTMTVYVKFDSLQSISLGDIESQINIGFGRFGRLAQFQQAIRSVVLNNEIILYTGALTSRM